MPNSASKASASTSTTDSRSKSTSNKVNPIPPGMRTVTPHLVCANASDAIAFYKKAFDATELNRVNSPDGKIMNAQLQVGDSMIMLVDEFPAWGSLGPKALKGSSVTIHLAVENVDEVVNVALAAGATLIMPVADMFWGDRYGVVEDPFGHRWSVGTHIRDVTPEEIRAAVDEMASHPDQGCVPAETTASK